MRLLNPDPGEILDRLTILARKIVERPEREDFKVEEKALVNALSVGCRELPMMFALAAVNAALWQGEDELRKLRAEKEDAEGDLDCGDHGTHAVYESGKVGLRLQSLNDQRSSLIQQLTVAFGGEAREEKITS